MFDTLHDRMRDLRPGRPPLGFHAPVWLWCGLWLGLVIPLASGCARAQAKTVPAGPPLEVPAPPPREVATIGTEVPQLLSLPEEPARTLLRPPPAARPEPTRADAGKPDTPKPDAPADPPRAADDSGRPPTTLQTTPAAEQSVLERGIRSTLVRATADLNRIDYRALNADARTQYDTAKRFIQQADDAIRSKNLVLARNLADKAATIAAQQAGR